MAKAAGGARRRRKSSGNQRSRGHGGGTVSWTVAALLVVGGIVVHDNWKRIQTALPEMTSKAPVRPLPDRAVPEQSARARMPETPTIRAKTVALAPATP